MEAIGIVIRALSKGGAEKQSLLLAKALKEEFDVFYFVQKKNPRSNSFVEFLDDENINYIQLTGNIIQRLWQLRSHIRNKKIKILFSYLFSDNVLTSISKFFNKDLFVIGGIRSNRIPEFKLKTTKLLHRFILDSIIVNNYDGKNFLISQGLDEKKLHVIHNCILMKEYEKKENECNSNTINILSVGRFVYQKDYQTSLASFELLQKKSPEIHYNYTIIGFGVLEGEIRDYIKTNNISNVEIILDPPNTELFYESADIYLNSSISEGLSNVLLEALNNKLPIVATDAGDNKYIVVDGVSGYLVNPRDINTISDKLLELSINREKRKTFGEQGYAFLKKNYSLESFRDKYSKYIKEIINCNV